jgi:glycosyltransferase involved in cell wall biosynthesis
VKSVTIIIPVKDEEVGLQYLLDNYKSSTLFNNSNISFIFVIDGRTSDLSKIIAQNFSDLIIDQNETHGKGAAIRQALQVWNNNMTDLVLFMDADGSYSFEGMGRLHNFGNHFLSKVSSLRNRRKLSDLCTGLWGFKSDTIPKLGIRSNGFDLEAEIVGKIRRAKLNHVEIPVNWSARKGGASKLKSFRDGTIILLRILRT